MSQKTILYIEDDEDDREMFIKALKHTGKNYNLLIAKDGEEGIQILKDSEVPFFLIICDASMPKLNGVEVLKAIENDPAVKVKKIPYILITGQKNPKIVEEAFALSTQGFFKKAQGFDDEVLLLTTIIDYWEKGYII